MFDGVGVNGFVYAAVNGQVGLLVAFEVEGVEGGWPINGFFKDGSGDGFALPLDLAGTADVEGDEFHGLCPEFSHELHEWHELLVDFSGFWCDLASFWFTGCTTGKNDSKSEQI
jgi:hypothetical protein